MPAVYPFGAEVFVHYTCDDGSGGSGILACLGSLPEGAPLPTDRLGTFAVQVVAFDNACNHATAAHFYRVVDLTPPTITINAPNQDAQYHVGEVVTADYSCHDDVEGSSVSCAATRYVSTAIAPPTIAPRTSPTPTPSVGTPTRSETGRLSASTRTTGTISVGSPSRGR